MLQQRSAEHRVTEFSVAGGKTTIKDPIYEALISGDNFGRLLHERPLYLKGRSVLNEQPLLYRRSIALYKTRNKIAHKGSPPEEEEYLFLSPQGARDGLTTAIDVFHWFGDPGPYVLWGRMVEYP